MKKTILPVALDKNGQYFKKIGTNSHCFRFLENKTKSVSADLFLPLTFLGLVDLFVKLNCLSTAFRRKLIFVSKLHIKKIRCLNFIVLNKDLVIYKHVKNSEMNRRVFMAPLSR